MPPLVSKKQLIFLVVLLAFLVGCAPRYEAGRPVLVTFKTPSLRFADQGFLSTLPKSASLEVYSAGTPITRIIVNEESVCTDSGCISPESFVRDYIGEYLPKDTIYALFNKKRLAIEGSEIAVHEGGFVQSAVIESRPLKYVVTKDEVTLRFGEIIVSIKENP